MNKKINLGIIIGNLAGGGAERIAAKLSINLPDNINKYFILSNRKIVYDFEGEVILLNIKVSKNPVKSLYNMLKKILYLRRIKKRYKIDYSLSFMEGSNIVNILSKRKDKIIISIRTYFSTQKLTLSRNFFNFCIKKLYNRADLIVAVSELLKNDLINNYKINKDKIRVIYNFYEIEKIISQAHEALGEFEVIFKSPVIINVGRLTYQKGHWHLLKVFSAVKNSVSNTKLIILGDGELYDDLIKLSDNLGLKTFSFKRNKQLDDSYNVYFIGFQSNPFKFISRSKLFVLSSLYEGFPNVIAEAMVCGSPIMSSDCKSGPREILIADLTDREITEAEYEKYGILMPVFDGKINTEKKELSEVEKQWADTIEKVLCDEMLIKKYSDRSINRAQDFSKEKIIKEWEKIII